MNVCGFVCQCVAGSYLTISTPKISLTTLLPSDRESVNNFLFSFFSSLQKRQQQQQQRLYIEFFPWWMYACVWVRDLQCGSAKKYILQIYYDRVALYNWDDIYWCCCCYCRRTTTYKYSDQIFVCVCVSILAYSFLFISQVLNQLLCLTSISARANEKKKRNGFEYAHCVCVNVYI